MIRLTIGAMLWFSASAAFAQEAAHVLIYHHVSTKTPASTSVTPEQFARHVELIAERKRTVVPLQQILDALAKGRPFEPGALAITFDDASASLLDSAIPLLEKRGWPYTIFASTEAVDRGGALLLTWDQLRQLEKRNATIANHGHLHAHMLARLPDESAGDWRARVKADIEQAQRRLEKELTRPARIFAYPYGELDEALVELVAELGYLAVGQQSGPVGALTHPQAVPRFPVASAYADNGSLIEKLNTRALPVRRPEVPASLLAADAPAPTLSLELGSAPLRRKELACYVSGQPAARIEWADAAAGRLRVTAREALPVGRSKYTCTAPHETLAGVYYWYTHLWMRPPVGSSWYDG